MKLKGSKTEANLMTAFSGESMAHLKYMIYSERASGQGLKKYAEVISRIAENEKEHGEIWLKYLEGGETSLLEDLQDSRQGEIYEYTDMYKRFAEEAEAEGFADIAEKFRLVGDIENSHAKIYEKMIHNIENNQVFSRNYSVDWVCMACGNEYTGEEAPPICPVCGHPRSYREIKCDKL